jgi:hypothetical protein
MCWSGYAEEDTAQIGIVSKQIQGVHVDRNVKK